MPAPSGLYPGELLDRVGGKDRDVRYKATGEYRPPCRGEYYLSGAIVAAYHAPNDLTTSYWIAKPGRISTVTSITWTEDA
jgi:hypothetical protein